jgi:polar amino acid transport system substrate-binding protein
VTAAARAGLALLAVLLLGAVAGCGAQGAQAGRPTAAGQSAQSGQAARSAQKAQSARSVQSARNSQSAGACDPAASSLAPDGSPSVTSGSFAAKIRARGYLIAGVDQTTYDFGFLNPLTGQTQGFDIDMIDAVGEAIFGPGYARHIYFKAIHNADRISDIENGTVDIVADTMTINCQRLQQIDFSAVYYDAHAQLLVLKNSGAKSLADLKGQKACAVSGSDDIAIIERSGARPVEPTYWTDCLVDLQQGQVAGIVTDNSILHGLAAQDPFTTIVGANLEDEPYGLGISKQHPDFVRFVNAVLTQIESGGQWGQDYRQWVGSPAPNPPALQYAP